jgi:hypothetical protein
MSYELMVDQVRRDIAAVAYAPYASLRERREALESLKGDIRKNLQVVARKSRVEMARATSNERIQPGDRAYGVHMTHCYPLGGIDGDPNEVGYCKYGEDDVCPAAMYEDPLGEFDRTQGT